jgi:hypothetical protein
MVQVTLGTARILSGDQPPPSNSTGIYLVELLFDCAPTFFETGLVKSAEATVIAFEGQYGRPWPMVAFNPIEVWAEGVGEKVTRALVKRAYEERIILPRRATEFCEQRVTGWFFSEVM